MAIKYNKKCLVIGAGLSGEWAAKLLMSRGAQVTISDRKSAAELEEFISRFKGYDSAQLKWQLGGHPKDMLNGQNLVVVSPGVPWNKIPGMSEAVKKGLNVIGEMELASQETNVPLVAITGSNGKTTTTSLVGHIFKKLGVPAFVGGNIGAPLSRMVAEKNKASVAVVEVSSFQLETVKLFKASAAAILNISPDHLDRYDDMAEYFRTKTKIFINQSVNDWAIMNADDVLLSKKNTMALRFDFSRFKRPVFGAWITGGKVQVVRGPEILAEKPWDEFKLWGIHNQENLMAAVGLAMCQGLKADAVLDAAADFTVGEHRIELVGDYDGVKYYDDSKGTNVGSVIKALDNFDSPVVLIAGGREKGLDFKPLYGPVKNKVKLLVLIGEAKDNLRQALNGAAPMVEAATMGEAVTKAKNSAKPGEVVLLSPACASFDMFRDYKHRGEIFASEVRAINTQRAAS